MAALLGDQRPAAIGRNRHLAAEDTSRRGQTSHTGHSAIAEVVTINCIELLRAGDKINPGVRHRPPEWRYFFKQHAFCPAAGRNAHEFNGPAGTGLLNGWQLVDIVENLPSGDSCGRKPP